MGFLSRVLLPTLLLHYAVAEEMTPEQYEKASAARAARRAANPNEMKDLLAMADRLNKMSGGGGVDQNDGGEVDNTHHISPLMLPDLGGLFGLDGKRGRTGKGKPVVAKEIDVETAQKFMKELTTIVSSDEVQGELEAAFEKVDKTGGQQAVAKALTPVIDHATYGLVKSYNFYGGFTKGFRQAMMSVREAYLKTDDPQLKTSLETFTMLAMVDKIKETPEKAEYDKVKGRPKVNKAEL